MTALARVEPVTALPELVREAAQRLASAQSSAEVLDARDAASVAYDAAKSAARIARAKKAHDEVIVAVYRAQADALEIESTAKRRLADEYDAAQDRGEVRANGERSFSSAGKAVVAEIGVSPKDIHEARQLRDAARDDPGVTRRVIDGMLERGEEPTRAAVRREIVHVAKPKPRVSDAALWLWGRMLDFEKGGYFDKAADQLLVEMTEPMRADVRRLAPKVREFMEDMEVACDAA